MEATAGRYSVHSKMVPLKKKKDRWSEKILAQTLACLLVLGFFVGIERANVLQPERERLAELLFQDEDWAAFLPYMEQIALRYDVTRAVWEQWFPPIGVTAPIKVAAAPIELPALEPVFVLPMQGEITSNFGDRTDPLEHDERYHTGVDLAAVPGQTIVASSGGEVLFSGEQGGYGKMIKIQHPNGYVTLYAHCQELLVQEGDGVAGGQEIARAGSTGRSTGPHLHFEVMDADGEYLDPKTVIPL